MAFYLDTVHATVYGHIIILYAHQIKLSLPCEDELWEFDENSKLTTETLPPVKTPKFLGALKNVDSINVKCILVLSEKKYY